MDVYFDSKLQFPQSGVHTDVVWHSSSPLVAVCTQNDGAGGSLNIFNKEGERQQHATVQRSCQPTALAWHPQKKVVACGWENGELVVWNEAERELHEVPKLHAAAAITSIVWTTKGSRVITADENGKVIVWKADSRGRVSESPLHQLNIQEGVEQLLLRPLIVPENAIDIAALARAAVSGDESALDMFNWKKGASSKLTTSMFALQEAMSFFIGSENGTVYYCSENGRLNQPFKAEGPIRKLLYHPSKDILVTITASLVLMQHSISGDGDLKELMKVKLSGKSESPSFAWANKGLLLTATGEGLLRAWDLDNDGNFVLLLDKRCGYDANETVNCVCFNKAKGIITAGTNLGNVAMWKYSPPSGGSEAGDETCWRLQPPATVEGSIKEIAWASLDSVLAARTGDNVFLLTEQVLCSHFNDGIAVVQMGPHTLSVNVFESNAHHEIKADIQIKGVFVTKDTVVVWNGKRVIVFEYTAEKSGTKPIGSWLCDTPVACSYEQSVYTLEGQKLQVRTVQGTVKQSISFAETEGVPCCLDVCGSYLTSGTTTGIVKVYELSRREAKPHCSTKNVSENIPHFGTLLAAKCNCNGTRVSLQVMKGDGKSDPRLYIWDVELNSMQFFNFETGRGEQDDDVAMPTKEQESELSDTERGKNQAARDISLRYPARHFWDLGESRLLICEAKRIAASAPAASTENALQQAESLIVSLFTTPEYGVLIQDSFPMSTNFSCLLGMEVPYYLFVVKTEDVAAETGDGPTTPRAAAVASSPSHHVARKTMRDFVGLENANKSSRDAMMNFSFFLAAGNLDEAFKAIKLIKSEVVWENLAKMCVKTRRLDVAAVCMGNMCHARGAKALREAAAYPELDARTAVLALQLGMLEEAEMLLKGCKRYDLLNELYQANGHWSEAMSTAEVHDRIHLRTTYYNYAKHLEEKGDLSGAIPHYEKSDTHRFEVPRMLFDEPQVLEAYVTKTKDKALRKWWAQYMESTGEMEMAVRYYEAAQDYLSLVRVYCYCGNLDKAADVCNEMGDKAACYQLARTYETQGQIKESVHFFTRAQAFGNAVRLCKEHGMDDQLFNLALLGNAEDMLEAARYYEQKRGCQDKAVMLYHKAGSFSKALDLAFEAKLFGALQMVSESLTDKTDPEVLKRCATFFLENGQFDKAVDLLAVGQKFAEALKLCIDQHVLITEELAEKLTPQKPAGAGSGADSEAERTRVLEAIAEVCMQQRQYHLATKKFTQAGNRIKAMKALLKSGDTEKIIFFAGVSRQKEIYVMAGNYLQSLDWRKDPEIMKNIIGFYTKGKALDSLASFYEACAQVEIDDYQNYEKALGALGEAAKCLAKAKMKNAVQQEEKLALLKQQMNLMKKFVGAKRMYEEDTEEAMKQCQILLEEPNVNESVRIGDLYGFMIQHYARKEKYKLAYNLMEELRSKMPSVNMAFFIDMRTIEAIHKDLGIPLGRGIGAEKVVNGLRPHASAPETNGDEIDEDVVDELDNEC